MRVPAPVVRILLPVLLLAGAGAGLAWAGPGRKPPPDPEEAALAEVRHEWSRLVRDIPGVQVDADKRLTLLRRALALETESAVRWLIARIVEPAHVDIRAVLETELAEALPTAPVVVEFFRARLDAGESDRAFALEFLLDLARRERDAAWLIDWFDVAPREDRFRVLAVLGKLRRPETLRCAASLVSDPRWSPDDTRAVGGATIALSLSEFEGEPAARLLLLLECDPRTDAAVREAIEEATRSWKERDLRAHFDLGTLASGAAEERVANARFCGRIGLERARLPLLSIARNTRESPEVRAACAEALGGLRIARTHLARELTALARSGAPDAVRAAALRGVARLGVRLSAETLVGLVDGDLSAAAREALSLWTGRPADADWRQWLEETRPSLPEGA